MNKNIKNWKEIIELFDTIDNIIIQPNLKEIRVQGTKNSKFKDNYSSYINKEVAKAVYEKIKAVII